MATSSSQAEVKRVGKFGAVGIINTVLDFGIYNVLTSSFGFGLIAANLVSTTVAMIFSFFANKQVVFQQKSGSLVRQAATFFVFTAIGLYLIQNGVIKLLTGVWTAPLALAVSIVHALGLGHIFSDAFVIKNGAKVVGTLFSLTWNYLTYKKVVFKK